MRLQELLKAHGPYEFPITVRQLGEGADYRWVEICIKFIVTKIVISNRIYTIYIHHLALAEKRSERNGKEKYTAIFLSL